MNNCSYPNGECDAGVCVCAMTYNPYNRTVEYLPYSGDDCSFGESPRWAREVSRTIAQC